MRFVLALAAAAVVALLIVYQPGRPAAAPLAEAGVWSTAPPRAHATTRASAAAMVYVAGAVVRPGLYTVRSDARVAEALARAGGAKPGADMIAVNLAAHVRDGDEIAVPVIGAPARARPHRTSAPRARSARTSRASLAGAALAEPVDLNTADAAALASLPGIGPALADRIVAYRTQNGRFASTDELLDVSGFTDRRVEQIVPYLVVR